MASEHGIKSCPMVLSVAEGKSNEIPEKELNTSVLRRGQHCRAKVFSTDQ